MTTRRIGSVVILVIALALALTVDFLSAADRAKTVRIDHPETIRVENPVYHPAKERPHEVSTTP